MRTTLTLDSDVASRIERLRKDRPLRLVVNEALRIGLDQLESGQGVPTKRYRVKPVQGRPRRTDLDDVAVVIAELEGDAWR